MISSLNKYESVEKFATITPDPPINITVTTLTDTTATITWSPPDDGPTPINYTVNYSLYNDTYITSTTTPIPSIVLGDVTPLKPSTNYSITIMSNYDMVTSIESSQVNFTTNGENGGNGGGSGGGSGAVDQILAGTRVSVSNGGVGIVTVGMTPIGQGAGTINYPTSMTLNSTAQVISATAGSQPITSVVGGSNIGVSTTNGVATVNYTGSQGGSGTVTSVGGTSDILINGTAGGSSTSTATIGLAPTGTGIVNIIPGLTQYFHVNPTGRVDAVQQAGTTPSNGTYTNATVTYDGTYKMITGLANGTPPITSVVGGSNIGVSTASGVATVSYTGSGGGGGGTVTSVTVSSPLTSTQNPITTSATLSLQTMSGYPPGPYDAEGAIITLTENGLVSGITNGIPSSFNIKKYGALCDNTHDDQSSIELAINAAIDAGGGTILFPGGISYIGSPLNVPSSCSFVGANNKTSGLRIASSIFAYNITGGAYVTSTNMYYNQINQVSDSPIYFNDPFFVQLNADIVTFSDPYTNEVDILINGITRNNITSPYTINPTTFVLVGGTTYTIIINSLRSYQIESKTLIFPFVSLMLQNKHPLVSNLSRALQDRSVTKLETKMSKGTKIELYSPEDEWDKVDKPSSLK